MSINNQEKGSRLAYRKSDGSIFPIEHSFFQKTLAWVKLSKTNQDNIPRYILYVLTLPVVYPKKDNNIYIIMTWKYKEDFFIILLYYTFMYRCINLIFSFCYFFIVFFNSHLCVCTHLYVSRHTSGSQRITFVSQFSHFHRECPGN